MTDLTTILEWGIPRDLPTAIRQAEATAEVNGTYAKWQMVDPDKLASKDAKRYWDPALGGGESQFGTFEQAGRLTDGEWAGLFTHCRGIGVEPLATPFDLEAVDLLEELDVSAYKIASGDVNYAPLLKKVAATGKRVFLSTGAAHLGRVFDATSVLAWGGCPEIWLLACDLVYPCPAEQAAFAGQFGRLRNATALFGGGLGLSDHTRETVTGAVAVTLGATVLEKHVTLTPGGDSPDDHFALSVDQMREYVRLANEAAVLCAPVEGDPQAAARVGARRSAYAARDLDERQRITDLDVAWLRPAPEGSIQPTDDLTGRILKRAIQVGAPITWADLR